MGLVVATIFATLVISGHGEPPAPTAPAKTENAAELTRERDRLQLESSLRDEKLRQELATSQAELTRLKTESDLLKAKADQVLVEKKIAIDAAKVEMEALNSGIALENARKQAATQAELIDLRAARDRAEIEAELATAELTKRQSAFKKTELEWNMKTTELRAKLAQREKEEEADSYAEDKPVYMKNPVTTDGELVLTDRRIPLNGLISAATADFVCSRIDYFNNKNREWPIFIVIDDSPGGSVMAGNKILESMSSSAAPVYVVVKSFAASMAATIATLAPRSYAYPNAVILHHQISNGMMGNLTEQREGLKNLEQWWKRMATPIAAKMGISPDEFVKQMYAHTATGDWQEFADDAVKLHWIDVVVGRCRETAWRKNPDSSTTSNGQQVAAADHTAASTEKVDAKGRTYMVLPHLNPVDCYYLYNADGYYRTE
jgi:ATP-dependent Clp protease protease subunit